MHDDESNSQTDDDDDSLDSAKESDSENDLVSEGAGTADHSDHSFDGGSDDESGEEEEEFDEEAYMRQLEDEAFERELRKLTMDAMEKGKNLSRKQVAEFMPSGSHFGIANNKKKTLSYLDRREGLERVC